MPVVPEVQNLGNSALLGDTAHTSLVTEVLLSNPNDKIHNSRNPFIFILSRDLATLNLVVGIQSLGIRSLGIQSQCALGLCCTIHKGVVVPLTNVYRLHRFKCPTAICGKMIQAGTFGIGYYFGTDYP